MKVNRYMRKYVETISQENNIPLHTVERIIREYIANIKKSAMHSDSFNICGIATIKFVWSETNSECLIRCRVSEKLKDFIRDENNNTESSGTPRESRVIAEVLSINYNTTYRVIKDLIKLMRVSAKEEHVVEIPGVLKIEVIERDGLLKTYGTTTKAFGIMIKSKRNKHTNKDLLYSDRYKNMVEEKKLMNKFLSDSTVSDEDLEAFIN